MDSIKQIKTKPCGVNLHEVIVDGKSVAHLHFHRPHPNDRRKGSRCSGHLVGLVSGKRFDGITGYSYFKDVVRDLPFLLDEVL